MQISNIFEKLRDKFAWNRSYGPPERFWYFFWDLAHHYNGITQKQRVGDAKPNPDEIIDVLEASIKEFDKQLLITEKKWSGTHTSPISHPIDLNNINRYGWEWIMEHSKLIINLNHSKKSDIKSIEKNIEDHKSKLKGIFNDPERIGYKGKYR